MHVENIYKSLKIISGNLLYVLITNNSKGIIEYNNRILDYLFQQINSSILAADFIKNEAVFDEMLSGCFLELDYISNLYQGFSLDYQNLIDPKVENICFNSLIILGNCLEQLADLKLRVYSFFDRKSSNILFNRSLDVEKIENFSLTLLSKHLKKDKSFDIDKTKMCYEILGINKQVFILDFFLEANRKSYYKLEFYENELKKYYNLKKFENIEFIPVLLEKVLFFKAKLLLRFKKSYSDQGNILKLIQNKSIVDTDAIFSEVKTDKLRVFLTYAECHYIESPENTASLIENFFNNLDEIGANHALHAKIKYFKDIEENFSNLSALSDSLKINNKSAYSKHVSALIKLYSINNTYSKALLSNDLTFDKVVKEYEYVKDNLKAFNVNNFFGESRLLKFITNQVDCLLLKEKNEKHLSLLKKYIDKADEILKEYKKNINWSGFNYSYLFPLDFSEAFISEPFIINNNVNGLFISSGFCLPLDNQKYKDKLSEYSQKVFTYKSILHQIDQLYLEIKNVEKIEKEYEKKDAKYIEILGIFSSIIIFASAAFNVSINIGDKLDLKNIVLIFTSIGIVLILFLILVLSIARFSFRKLEGFLLGINFRNKYIKISAVLIVFLFSVFFYKLIDMLKFIIQEIGVGKK
ncbi:hypothetical protein [Sphingobacterium sp. BIGb0165]|uniref:hypothetical protein n=1 Tax=Sphingobacterium sp. BIGb0165 TaxID=2940615 RepID=UPI0021693784|nr:hypothetical protein [Sphingobacterium sp. BIGb0165]MCS4228906.1 hypothetical protein [Sphingobacterium sp. BIGb0165]